ncbi:MAG: type 4a pilus biogenesis protein PilO [Phycisphaerae bacterium]
MSQNMKKHWPVLLVAVGMLTVSAAAVFYPQHRELKELTGRIEAQRQVLDSDLQAAQRLPELIEEVEEMKRRYSNFDRRLPKQQELGEFLREITLNLPAEDLLSDRIEPGNPKREERFQTLPIRMRLRGHFLSLVRFLNRVEQMERLARVDKLSMEAQPDSDELTIEMRMNIYFLGD